MKATIEHVKTMSSHADQSELLSWMSGIKNKPKNVFIVHGEAHAADELRVKIQDEFGWHCRVPVMFEKVILDL